MKILDFIVVLSLVIIFSVTQLYSNTVQKSNDKDDNTIVAKIDNSPITYKEYKDFLKLFKKTPSNMNDKLITLDNLISRKLILEDAKRKGYFKRKDITEEIKKHKFNNTISRNIMVLRAYLLENISKKVFISEDMIKEFLNKHHGITVTTAKDMIAIKQEQTLFKKLITKLKKGKNIVIFKENLK